MTVLEIMERVGSREPEKIKVFIDDAINEISDLIPERTTSSKINVVADQRTYSLPSNMINLIGVYRRYDNQGRYIRIGRIASLDLDEPAGSTGGSTVVSEPEDIVVV